jgi:hypothetical protein
LDGFIAGVEEAATRAGISKQAHACLWANLANSFRNFVVDGYEMMAKESQVPPADTGIAERAFGTGLMSHVAPKPIAPVPGTESEYAMAGRPFMQRFRHYATAPGMLRWGVPGALLTALVGGLFGRGGGRNLLRNLLLGGGLSALAAPLYKAFMAGRPGARAGRTA